MTSDESVPALQKELEHLKLKLKEERVKLDDAKCKLIFIFVTAYL